ncbi:MAG: large subunit ribosomal protein L10 [Microgenomates group bacterium Gr01-1014_16]|nr:MAG: large subunit ribosomal protein L10 [Microgenomates group bacterium Gr01-1014_16]
MTKNINPAKASVVASLKDLLSRSKSVAIVDYQGLKVSQATLLRSLVKKAGGQIVIAKNTLFKIALGKDVDISGANAFVFALNDEITPLKAVSDFAKKNQLPVFKSGLYNDRVLTAAEITDLAGTPDLKTSAAKLVYILNWNIIKLVRTLKEVSLKHV